MSQIGAEKMSEILMSAEVSESQEAKEKREAEEKEQLEAESFNAQLGVPSKKMDAAHPMGEHPPRARVSCEWSPSDCPCLGFAASTSSMYTCARSEVGSKEAYHDSTHCLDHLTNLTFSKDIDAVVGENILDCAKLKIAVLEGQPVRFATLRASPRSPGGSRRPAQNACSKGTIDTSCKVSAELAQPGEAAPRTLKMGGGARDRLQPTCVAALRSHCDGAVLQDRTARERTTETGSPTWAKRRKGR